MRNSAKLSKRIGKNLKLLREERGVPVVKLAAGIVTRQHIYKIEAGEKRPSLELLGKLAARLNVEVATILDLGKTA